MSLFQLMNVRRQFGILLVLGTIALVPATFGQSSTPGTSKSDEIRGDTPKSDARSDMTPIPSTVNRGDGDTGSEPDAPQTVYSKTGLTDHKEDNPYNIGPQRGRVNYGKKKGEQMIEIDSSKPVALKQTKFGADVSEPTGVFKKSLLDSALDTRPLPSAQPKASVDPRFSKPAQQEKKAASEPVVAPQLDIGLGITPGTGVAPKAASDTTAEPSPVTRP